MAPHAPNTPNSPVMLPTNDMAGEQRENAKTNGHRACALANGAVYDGEWKDGLQAGTGKKTWADGSFCEGHWVAGKMEGNGREVYPNGDIYEGEYQRGKRHGTGT